MTPRETVLNATRSLCPVCLRRIPAWNVRRGDNVYLVKQCPDHGRFRTVIWRGEPAYETWGYPHAVSGPDVCATSRREGCPFDCGLCPEHRTAPCAVLLEVTSRCNLRCPVCFADAGSTGAPDPGLDLLERQYRSLLAQAGPCNVQLSGGEPTLRDDLPDIVALGRRLGFDFIQINTNGLRLASDPEYVRRLKEAGLACAFLQCDGLTDGVFLKLRGQPLLRIKEAAIDHCAAHGIGVVLAATLVPGVNTDQIGALAEYALRRVPQVRGLHLQPIGYLGRYPGPPTDEDRLTLPEIIRALEEQTSGRLRASCFLPPAGENAHCSFHANIAVLQDGSLQPWVSDPASYYRSKAAPDRDGSRHARHFMARQWRAANAVPACARVTEEALSGDGLDDLLERMRSHTLSISAMAFQDIWNLDLNRLRDCHIGTVGADGRIIPFCAYNLTSLAGHSLYRNAENSL